VGYVFIDRLIHRQPDLLVTSLNVHRLLVTSVMVATKMLDDVWVSSITALPFFSFSFFLLELYRLLLHINLW
jgi:hypothetical protein